MNDDTSHRVELYVRSLAPCGVRTKQEAIVERLLDLEREGVLDHVDLTVWGDAVCLDGASAHVGVGSHVAERIRTFHDWCENRRTSLDPFFTWSDVESSITGDSFQRVVPPHRCLAVYVDDRLREVYPCEVDGAVRSLEEGLQSLERRRSRTIDPSVVSEEVG